MRTVRFVGAIAALAMVVTLAGCGGQKKAASGVKGGPLEVGVLWDEGSPSYALVKEIGDQMEKDFPGTKVTYTFNNNAARPALDTRAKAGNPLDIDCIFTATDPGTYSWADGGYLLDIGPAMGEKRADGTTWKDDFNPLFLSSMAYKDKIYGAPTDVYLLLLHYNKKMFDELGLTPPKTWEELLSTCETIKQKGKGVAPIAVTGQVDFYAGMWWDYLVQRMVGSAKAWDYLYGDKDAKIAEDADYLAAAREMKKLAEKGYLIDGWQGTDFTTSQIYFFQGKAAMILMGSWLMTEMKDSIPADFQLAVAPFPSVAGGKGDQNGMFGKAAVWNVMAKSRNPALATEFLRRFTGKDVGQKRSDRFSAITPLQGVAAPKGLGGIDAALKDAAKAELTLYHFGMLTAQFGAKAAWYGPVVEMCTGKLSAQQALAKIDANIASVRAQRKAAAKP